MNFITVKNGRITSAMWYALLIVTVSFSTVYAAAQKMPVGMKRYAYSGDGQLNLYSDKTKQSFSGMYRNEDNHYIPPAIEDICRVFGAPAPNMPMGLSLRLVEFIDFLQDHFAPNAKITITSGYRKPEYNTMLRKKGKLAAKASLHQYGMAADLNIQGINSKKIWNYIKALNFGGTGYYNGVSVHIDVGPARFWDQTTSGVGTGISNENKLIGLVTDADFYQPEMTVFLRFIRMTAFPVNVNKAFFLIRKSNQADETVQRFTPEFPIPLKSHCPQFEQIDQMDRIHWKLPPNLAAGQYTIQVRFCRNSWPEMPSMIETPEFNIN